MKPKTILDVKLVNQLRLTHTDIEMAKQFKTSTVNINLQCGRRSKLWIPFIQRNMYNRKKPLWPYKKTTNDRELPTQSWKDDKRTAKHEIVVPNWFELVEYWTNPCRAFYDKLNS